MREYLKHCLYCGDEFFTANYKAKYCSSTCRKLQQIERMRKRRQYEALGERLKAKIKEHKEKEYNERVKLSKTTGVSYGTITAYWHNKEQLKNKIEYEQKVGRAHPIDLEESRKVNWRG